MIFLASCTVWVSNRNLRGGERAVEAAFGKQNFRVPPEIPVRLPEAPRRLKCPFNAELKV
jgi:hypothetical protein